MLIKSLLKKHAKGNFVFFNRRKATPVKNTENIEGAVRKEEQGTAVMSYATLNDRNGGYQGAHPNMYENVHEGEYDAPYEDSGHHRSVSSGSSHYEPSPVGVRNGNVVTINGVSVR